MSREVCGICWCPYDEDTGECACAPDPAAVLPRKPLTDEEIIDLWEGVSDPESPEISMIDFARAIERAHNIT